MASPAEHVGNENTELTAPSGDILSAWQEGVYNQFASNKTQTGGDVYLYYVDTSSNKSKNFLNNNNILNMYKFHKHYCYFLTLSFPIPLKSG